MEDPVDPQLKYTPTPGRVCAYLPDYTVMVASGQLGDTHHQSLREWIERKSLRGRELILLVRTEGAREGRFTLSRCGCLTENAVIPATLPALPAPGCIDSFPAIV